MGRVEAIAGLVKIKNGILRGVHIHGEELTVEIILVCERMVLVVLRHGGLLLL